MKKILLCLCFIIVLTGCSAEQGNVNNNDLNKSVGVVSETDSFDDVYSLYIKKNSYVSALYEPENGCYLGAYILSDKNVDFNIKNFEALTDKEHCNYIFHLKLGQELPIMWLMECISEQKTPCIIIEEQDSYSSFDLEFLEKTALSFGKYKIPMFVVFYPEPQKNNYNSEDYKKFFVQARNAFKKYSPSTAFVWSVDLDDVYDSSFFYPGNEYTDWVGFSTYLYSDEQEKYNDILNSLDYFYYNYQEDKPIMITEFAVSHYSSGEDKYYIDEASEELKYFYNLILKNYPRIKAVNYMDFNNFDIAPKNALKEDFTITDSAKILKNYKAAVNNNLFLSSLENNSSSDSNKMILSPFNVYKFGNEFYITENTMKYNLNVTTGYDKFNIIKVICGETCYPLSEVKQNFGIDFYDDAKNKKIFASIK